MPPFRRAQRARLLLDLDELAKLGWVSLDVYALVRRIDTTQAARRSVYRLKSALAAEGVALEVTEKNGIVLARFGTPEIAAFLEPDLREARVLVERLDAAREGRAPDLAGLANETDLMNPEAISIEYRARLRSLGWIAHKHGVGTRRLRKILASTGPIRSRGLRPIEGHRPRALVERALEAIDRRAPLREIAEILGCTRATAQRFMARHGRALLRGRPRTS